MSRAPSKTGWRLVETGLADDVRVADPLADAASRYLYEAGGKRIRPVLTLLAAQLGDGNTPEVIDVAKALEITHLGSLYHDDVMDEPTAAAEYPPPTPCGATTSRSSRATSFSPAPAS